jgi:phytoene synthase
MVSRTHLTTTKEIQKRTGKTFHFATRLLPRRIRHGTYVLYAFFRVADEVVDDPDAAPPEEQRAELDRIEAAALGEEPTDDAVLEAFREVKEEVGIDDREVEAFVDAMRMDIDTDRYADHDELATYLRGSAVAVGHMMTALMDPDDPEAARPHATALGEAFQLTNFLRDVREDVVDYDRIYVPQSVLAEHGVDERSVLDLEYTPEFGDAMRAELARTECKYHEGVQGIRYLPEDCQFAVLLSAVLYADHHHLIRGLDHDVLSQRRTLSTARRVRLAVRTWLHWKRTGDPVETFYAASAIDPPEDAESEVDPAITDDRASPVPLPLRTAVGGAKRLAGSVLTGLR